ncbi:hypothetical protein [Paracoccus versutus]
MKGTWLASCWRMVVSHIPFRRRRLNRTTGSMRPLTNTIIKCSSKGAESDNSRAMQKNRLDCESNHPACLERH